MDRTLIAPYRAEEKDLSEKLYKKLDGLMLIYPPSEELKKHFTKDMFIKSNPIGFFHVFHYLLRIYDAAEFKKRFYWPITDKRGESSFRTATVEYLKFLSDKHQLNWNVKSYLVQMPGGMKFLTFVLEFVGFIIGEQIRVREKQLGMEVPVEFSERNLRRIQKKHLFFKDYTSDYISEVEQLTLNLRRKTQLIKAELSEVEYATQTDINNYLQVFEASNERLFETNLTQHSQNVMAIEKLLMDLKINIDMYQQKIAELRKDKRTLRQALQKINDCQETVKPTMDNVTRAFVEVHPIMENWLSEIVAKNSTVNDDMTVELIRLKTELEQIEAQISVYHQKFTISVFPKAKETHFKELVDSRNLLSKYVFTPPIKVNPTENPKSHLPLLGESNFGHNSDVTGSARKVKPSNTSFDLSTTLNRAQIIDPIQMLRTIYKDSSKKKTSAMNQSIGNTSLLGIKWKERQQLMFGAETIENITPIKLNSENAERPSSAKEFHIDIKISSPRTPFNTHSDDITRIAVKSYKNSPNVRKVDALKEESYNIKNLSTSPTGRLDALCCAEEYLPIQGEVNENFGKVTMKDTENNQNSINMAKKIFDLQSLGNDDSIFNTSDTVLKDIV